MLATSIRQPSSEKGFDEPVPDDLEHPPLQLGRAPVELRQAGNAVPRLVAVRQPLVEHEEARAPASPDRRSACRNHGWPFPQWFSVRSPTMRRPRAWTASASEASARSPPRSGSISAKLARVVAVRASRREDRRQVEDGGAEPLDVVEALLDPARSPPNHSCGVSGPRPVGSSSQPRGTAQPGGSAAWPLAAKRSGKISYTTERRCQSGPPGSSERTKSSASGGSWATGPAPFSHA